MKKCPTCQRTFDDDKRFCQSDGTPLVEAGESSNPYATIVANRDEIASSIPPESSSAVSTPKDSDVLEIPEAEDSMKTSVVTELEMREMAIESDLSGKSAPLGSESKSKESDFSSPIPTPPIFNEPDLNPPKFGDSPFSLPDSPKPSPGAGDFSAPESDRPFNPPIPSPFGEKMPPSYQTPSNSPFQEPEPPKNEPFSPFNEPASPFGQTPFGEAELKNQPVKAEWTPPESPQSSFGEPAAVQNPPSSSAPAAAGQNKTLAIVSLVLGILSIPCCSVFIIGLAAVVTGFIAKSKADNNPNEYGGRTFALIGIGIGALTTIVAFVVNLLYLLGYIKLPNM